MSEHYRYEIIPCRVRKPQEKGKVEAGIKYVRSNFFKGRSFNSREDVEKQLRDWVKYKCNSRIHGTTKKYHKKYLQMKRGVVYHHNK